MGKQLVSGSPNPVLWEEICYITDLNLRTARGAIKSCGRSMGLAVMGEWSLWLNLSSLSDREKADLLNAPIDPKELFGPVIAAMRTKCDLQKKEWEVLNVCLPCRPAPRPAPAPRSPPPPPPQPRSFQQPRPLQGTSHTKFNKVLLCRGLSHFPITQSLHSHTPLLTLSPSPSRSPAGEEKI